MQEEQEEKEEKMWRNISKKLVLSFILKRKKMKKRERKLSYLKKDEKIFVHKEKE